MNEELSRIEKAENDGKTVLALKLVEDYLKQNHRHSRAWAMYGALLQEMRRFDKSLEAYENSLKYVPEDYKAYVLASIGLLYKEWGDITSALRYFNEAANADKLQTAWIYILLGYSLHLTGDESRAIDCFNDAISIGGDDYEEAYLNLALISRANADYNAAFDYAQKALAIDSDYTSAQRLIRSLDFQE